MSRNQAGQQWSSFEALSLDTPKSITWASRGGDGSGKSYFACTTPAPIFVCAFDPHGMSRVAKEVREGKEIRIGRYGFAHLKGESDREKVRKAGDEIWTRFTEQYREALKHCKSVIWDREDLAWELMRYASFGGEKNEGSRTGALDYGDLNAEYVGLIQEARDAEVNLGLLQGVKEKWVAKFNPQKAKMENYNTGELIPDGFKKISDHVDLTLDHRWDPTQKEYVIRIGKFPNKEFKDNEFANLDFPNMATLAFPDTSVDDWS